MSFHFSFAARTIQEARSKLHDVYVPAAVKALVEKALDAVAEPRPLPEKLHEVYARSVPDQRAAYRDDSGSPAAQPPMIGIFVEVAGHIADAGSGCESEIQKFIVKPLFV